MSNLAQPSSSFIPYGNVVKLNPKRSARRRIAPAGVVLAAALFAGAGWVMSYSIVEPSSASTQEAQTTQAPDTAPEFVYFPSQYVNQGTTEPTEPIPTF